MTDPFVEILGPLGVLRDRIEQAFLDHGLKVTHVSITPGSDVEGPHELNVIAVLSDKQSDPTVDDDFERVLREARDAENENKARQAEHELEERLRRNEGFLD